MALTAKMVASEILVCGVKAGIKSIPFVGEMAVNVVDGLQKRHETLAQAARMDEFDAKLSRVELNMRKTVETEIRTILDNLGRPAVLGPELTREMNELRQIYEQGWVPNLFEGILRNSTHLEELRRSPTTFGHLLDDHTPVDPKNGMHLLVEKDRTRILELPVASLAHLLSNQAVGVPPAHMKTRQDIWALPCVSEEKSLTNTITNSFGTVSHGKPISSGAVIEPAQKARLTVAFAGDRCFAPYHYESSWMASVCGTWGYRAADIKIDGRKIGSEQLDKGFRIEANIMPGEHVLLLECEFQSKLGSAFIKSQEIRFVVEKSGAFTLHVGSVGEKLFLSSLEPD